MSEEVQNNAAAEEIRPDVLTTEDVCEMVPRLASHPKLVSSLLKFLKLDRINEVHRQCCTTPGPECATRLLFESFNIDLRVDGTDVLNRLPEGAFITVSNHPYGALDGIALIHLIGSRRPQFKVMVNMILNRIGGLRQNFIAVDAWAQNDPSKRAVSVNGIRQCLRQLKDGEPMGFFPAGAMSKVDRHWQLQDRPWQDSVLQIIHRANVPVVPVFFHGGNSQLFNVMGHLCWPLRSVMLPREVVRKTGKQIHVSIGEPITVEQQAPYRESPATLGAFLREQTYALRARK
jgi:putative hemolysin